MIAQTAAQTSTPDLSPPNRPIARSRWHRAETRVEIPRAGWKLGAYGGRWRIVYQGNGANKDPILMYPATWVIFDMYDYNFTTGQWAYLPD